MKQFFKFAFASAFGLMIALTILFFVMLFGIVSAASFTTNRSVTIKEKSLLHISLNGSLQERVEESPIGMIMSGYEINEIGLDDQLKAIDAASTHPNVSGIYLELGGLSAELASVEELRDALSRFKERGKFIVAFGDVITQNEYYLGTIADVFYVSPNAMIEFGGLSIKQVFFKEALDKLGVSMQTIRVGEYKSAVEPFTLTRMSEANRLQTDSLVHSLWSSMTRQLSAVRHIPVDSLNRMADKQMLFVPGEEYVRQGLVDKMLMQSEVEAGLKEISRLNDSDDLRLVTVGEMIASNPLKSNSEKIALLYAVGEIDAGDPTEGIFSADFCKELNKLERDEEVKAVVIRVNSPGGSATGSDNIYMAIESLKQHKPVVVSMGDYAASGGYYIACNANYIYTQPTTITGSIGIFGLIPNAEVISNKIGLSFDEVATNKHSGFPSFTRAMKADEQAIMQGYVQRGYDLFISRCAEGRGMEPEKIRAIAEGRVWSGEQAVAIGLVDSLGGIDAAIRKAAELAAIDRYDVEEYPRKKDWMDLVIKDLTGGLQSRIGKAALGPEFAIYHTLRQLTRADLLQARLPYEIRIGEK